MRGFEEKPELMINSLETNLIFSHMYSNRCLQTRICPICIFLQPPESYCICFFIVNESHLLPRFL